MRFSQLRTVDLRRPGVGKRYSLLPVDRIDITGFHISCKGSPLRPHLLDIREGDTAIWEGEDGRYQATVDEVVVDGDVLRVAFRDAAPCPDAEW